MEMEFVQRKLCTVKCVHKKNSRIICVNVKFCRDGLTGCSHFISKQFSMSQHGANKQRLADSLQ